jgi:hypothetical protein
METFKEGLRCQDIHGGLRGVDPNSAAIAPLEDTRIVGMAATLASTIRGQEIIRDAQTLKAVAGGRPFTPSHGGHPCP